MEEWTKKVKAEADKRHAEREAEEKTMDVAKGAKRAKEGEIH